MAWLAKDRRVSRQRLRWLSGAVLWVALGAATTPAQAIERSAPVVLDRVVAVVNGRAILSSDVE